MTYFQNGILFYALNQVKLYQLTVVNGYLVDEDYEDCGGVSSSSTPKYRFTFLLIVICSKSFKYPDGVGTQSHGLQDMKVIVYQKVKI